MPSAAQTLTTVVVYDYLFDPTTGSALANAPVTVSLLSQGLTVAPATGGATSVVLAPRSYSTTTDNNGYWQVSVVPTNLLSQTGARYAVNDGYQAPYQINPIQAGIPAAGWQSSAIRTTGAPTLVPTGQTVAVLTVTGLLTAQGGVNANTINDSALALGQVVFSGALGLLTGDNNLFWDNTNKRLGIGYATPYSIMYISGGGGFGAPVMDQATLAIYDTGNVIGNGGSLVLGAGAPPSATAFFAGIKGYLQDSSNRTRGDLVFWTRTNTLDTNLTEKLRITSSGHLISSGAVPTLGALQANVSSQSITGTDTRHTVTVTAAATPVANQNAALVTYSTAFGTPTPIPVITPTAPGLYCASGGPTTTGYNLYVNGSLAASATALFAAWAA